MKVYINLFAAAFLLATSSVVLADTHKHDTDSQKTSVATNKTPVVPKTPENSLANSYKTVQKLEKNLNNELHQDTKLENEINKEMKKSQELNGRDAQRNNLLESTSSDEMTLSSWEDALGIAAATIVGVAAVGVLSPAIIPLIINNGDEVADTTDVVSQAIAGLA